MNERSNATLAVHWCPYASSSDQILPWRVERKAHPKELLPSAKSLSGLRFANPPYAITVVRARPSHHPRHAQQPRPLRIGRLDSLLRSEHHHPPLGSHLRHGVAEVADVGGGGRQGFLAHTLARRAGVADPMTL